MCGRSGRGRHAGRLGALRALGDFVADALAFLQAAEALGCDRGIMHEHIGAAVFRCDETEALRVVEPLHGAVLHSVADLMMDALSVHRRVARPVARAEYAKPPTRLAITPPAGCAAGGRRPRWRPS